MQFFFPFFELELSVHILLEYRIICPKFFKNLIQIINCSKLVVHVYIYSVILSDSNGSFKKKWLNYKLT